MTCRDAQIGSAVTSYVLHATELEERQVLSLYHEIMREGRAAEADAPSPALVRRLANSLTDTVNRDTTLSSARRQSLLRRLGRARTETIDGARHYATIRLMERARRAEVALSDYVAATARDTGLNEDEVRARIRDARREAGADRTVRPTAGFVDALRSDPTTRDLPLDRQTAYAIEQMQTARAQARAAAPTRRAVTRHPQPRSSSIAELGYDDTTGRVEVVMRSNPDVVYAYRMTWEEWNEFAGARSVGSYYARHVRGNDDFRYSDATSAREAGTHTQCPSCGQFADDSHACPPRGSTEEREVTERRARVSARRRVTTTPAADTDTEAVPVRVAGRRRNYHGQSGKFRAPSLSNVQTQARRNPAGVRVPITSAIAAYSGPDGPITGLHSGGRRGLVTGYALVTYNGRGRGYSVTHEHGQGDTATTGDRLRCDCPDYREDYDCPHVRQTLQDLTTRLNADSLRDYHMYGPAIEAVTADLAQDHADSQTAQQVSRDTWQANPTYTTDHAVFQADYRAAKARMDAGEDPVPYMTENATDGLGAPGTGRAFGVELEFVIPNGNRARALEAIARDLYDAGLTSSRYQQGYHSTSSYSTSHQGGWRFEQDATVDGEIISPIMHDTPETWENLAKVCEIVERHGGTVNYQAGSHVHVSAGNYDHTVENHNRLLASFAENEDLIYRLSTNPDRPTHRGSEWCRPNTVPAGGYTTVHEARRGNYSHHIGLNLQGVSGNDSDHVEFRTFDGTLKPSVIQAQIKLALGITEAAFRDTDYQPGAHTPLGSHRSHNRNAYGASRRLTGQDWRNDVAGYKALADRIFRRPEDKAQLTALFAATRWQRRN